MEPGPSCIAQRGTGQPKDCQCVAGGRRFIMRPNNDNNVYILGAGFSVEAGLPVISSFLARMRDAVDWLEKDGRDDERKAIERVLDFRHKSAAAGYRINI